MSLLKVCNLDDIQDGDARGFDMAIGERLVSIICIRRSDQLFVYKNSCPHTGVNLEWLPDQFLDTTQQYLVCSTHGALFQVEDGHCVAGPCAGDALQKVTATIKNRECFVDSDSILNVVHS